MGKRLLAESMKSMEMSSLFVEDNKNRYLFAFAWLMILDGAYYSCKWTWETEEQALRCYRAGLAWKQRSHTAAAELRKKGNIIFLRMRRERPM